MYKWMSPNKIGWKSTLRAVVTWYKSSIGKKRDVGDVERGVTVWLTAFETFQ